MLKIKYIVIILFCALLGQLDAQIAKEWVIGYDYFQPSPLRIIYRTKTSKVQIRIWTLLFVLPTQGEGEISIVAH